MSTTGTAQILRSARRRAGLSLRALAALAGTSHATIVAYEAGRKAPSVQTRDRLLRAAGFEAADELRPSVAGPDPAARGRELIEALELAEMFPARHARKIEMPKFGAT